MMTYFQDAADVDHFIGGIFTECLTDPDLGPKFAASGTILRLNFTEPDVTIVVDCANNKVYTGAALAGAPDSNVEMFMTSDVAHRYWLGQVNVSVALAKGMMRAKGPIPRILKLVPLTKHVFPRYQRMIEESGRPELRS
jgi:hypothetical protein